MPGENWRPIRGHEGRYMVSDLGNVLSLEHTDRLGRPWRTRLLRPALTSRGYLAVVLYRSGTRESLLVHRLVAETFMGHKPMGATVHHKDGIKINNSFGNLEYCSLGDNIRRAWREGLCPDVRGEGNHHHKLTVEQATKIKCGHEPQRILGELYGVHQATISKIRNGVAWSHIKEVA